MEFVSHSYRLVVKVPSESSCKGAMGAIDFPLMPALWRKVERTAKFADRARPAYLAAVQENTH